MKWLGNEVKDWVVSQGKAIKVLLATSDNIIIIIIIKHMLHWNDKKHAQLKYSWIQVKKKSSKLIRKSDICTARLYLQINLLQKAILKRLYKEIKLKKF